MMKMLSVLILLLIAPLIEADENVNHGIALIEWLRERGGTAHKDMEIRTFPNTSIYGVFATADIKKDDVLLDIPETCLLRASDGPYTRDDSMDMCDTTANLLREYVKGAESEFAPYIDYTLRNPNRATTPPEWSDEALELMETIVGIEMEPQGLSEGSFYQSCGYDFVSDLLDMDSEESQELAEIAFLTVISRSWNEVMVPLYDMVNHRNGDRWHNAGQRTSAHVKGQPIVIVALRDIRSGEQIYNSYNECNDTDCHGTKYTYVAQQIFKDYGFVEQYPQRWKFEVPFDGDLIFEIDQVEPKELPEEGEELKIIFPFDTASLDQFHWLHGHLKRQRGLKEYVESSLAELESEGERYSIRSYYQALTTALEVAVRRVDPTRKAVELQDGDGVFDDLQVHNAKPGGDGEEDEGLRLCSEDRNTYLGDAPYEYLGDITSQYQNILFDRNWEVGDTCLRLSDWLQTCTSWRSHYHESIVHYPARFLKEVKRVIFLGGGDNMMLHEVLKYPELEVVMGMELDQEVVRSSFKFMGTQPHFDNPKVQWWFGDATKSLSMLLEQGDDFYGTFDLVIVDLQTNVAETLMVTHDKSIMDVALQLMRPETGILARNEDFYPRESVGFAKYEVDLEYLDVPMLCQQSITIGSSNVDFLTHPLTGHPEVDTVYLNVSSLDDGTDKYSRWLNYRHNENVTDPDPSCDPLFSETDLADERRFGVHMILEVEDTNIAKGYSERVFSLIKEVMSKIGFSEHWTNDLGPTASIFLYTEGYVTVQIWPDESYIGLDVKLFSNFGKLDSIRALLVAALSDRPDDPSSSSLRVVTGGMFGTHKAAKTQNAPTCSSKGTLDTASAESITDSSVASIIQKTASMSEATDPVIAVVCPESESDCTALEALRKSDPTNVFPVLTCPDLGSDADRMTVCAEAISSVLFASVESLGKIDLILVDFNAPKATGQILHKVLRDKARRLQLLQESYAVMTLSMESSPASWQQALLERFQTEFDIHSPAQRALLAFESQWSNLEIGLFSSDGMKLFHSASALLDSVEEETGLVGHLRRVNDGAIQYRADFTPNVIGHTKLYDQRDARAQWLSQTAVGHQTILQFDIKPVQSPLEDGTQVLINHHRDIWTGEWSFGRVVQQKESGSYAVVAHGNENESLDIGRDALVRFENKSPLSVRQPVLIRRERVWTQGAVIEELADEMFRIRGYDSEGDILTVHRRDLVSRIDAGDATDAPKLSSAPVEEMVGRFMVPKDLVADSTLRMTHIAEGCVVTASWNGGIAVVTWDGRAHIDASIFTAVENDRLRDHAVDAILSEFPFLGKTSRDELPRGHGRVVNLNSQTQIDFPYWAEL